MGSLHSRSLKKDEEFEVRFLEGVLARKGDFFEVLSALGDLYTRGGMFRKGFEMDLKLVALRPEDPYVLYNLACSHSLLGEFDLAFEALKKAIHWGYDDFEHLLSDEDLIGLLRQERFREYLSHLAQKSSATKKL